MATLNYNTPYFPEDTHNISYDETAYFIYNVDIDEKERKNKIKEIED